MYDYVTNPNPSVNLCCANIEFVGKRLKLFEAISCIFTEDMRFDFLFCAIYRCYISFEMAIQSKFAESRHSSKKIVAAQILSQLNWMSRFSSQHRERQQRQRMVFDSEVMLVELQACL